MTYWLDLMRISSKENTGAFVVYSYPIEAESDGEAKVLASEKSLIPFFDDYDYAVLILGSGEVVATFGEMAGL